MIVRILQGLVIIFIIVLGIFGILFCEPDSNKADVTFFYPDGTKEVHRGVSYQIHEGGAFSGGSGVITINGKKYSGTYLVENQDSYRGKSLWDQIHGK